MYLPKTFFKEELWIWGKEVHRKDKIIERNLTRTELLDTGSKFHPTYSLLPEALCEFKMEDYVLNLTKFRVNKIIYLLVCTNKSVWRDAISSLLPLNENIETDVFWNFLWGGIIYLRNAPMQTGYQWLSLHTYDRKTPIDVTGFVPE